MKSWEREDLCQDLHDMLSGNLLAEYLSDVDELLQHWYDCANCQIALPDADVQFKNIEDYVVRQLRTNMKQLHQQYCVERDSMVLKAKWQPVVSPVLLTPPIVETI